MANPGQSPQPAVTILRAGNRIAIDGPESLKPILEDSLHFVARRFLQGWEAKVAGTDVELKDFACYTHDFRGRLVTTMGFYDKICGLMTTHGYKYTVKDFKPHKHPEHLIPVWDRLYDPERGITLRYGQEEFLVKLATRIADRNPGNFDCPPAFGKSTMIGLVGLLYPKLRIDVVSRRVPVLCDRIYKYLTQMLPSVGVVGGGLRIKNKRIMLYTVGSLPHSTGDADIVIGDEVHELGATQSAGLLARYENSTNIGLSATHNMRLDNTDMRVEGMFGPVVYSMSYEEAAKHGLVTRIKVLWSNVVMDSNPCSLSGSKVDKKRDGFWCNTVRNQIIANDAEQYEPDVQRLITCETIEHVLMLKLLLPDYTIVYSANGVKPDDLKYFHRLGIWPSNESIMTLDRLRAFARQFETNRLKKVIATTVWNVGVDFTHLAVLLRADGGGSPINDVQIPGRTSRLQTDKDYGIIHDYLDQFDPGFHNRAMGRKRTYESQGWEQVMPSKIGPAQGRLF